MKDRNKPKSRINLDLPPKLRRRIDELAHITNSRPKYFGSRADYFVDGGIMLNEPEASGIEVKNPAENSHLRDPRLADVKATDAPPQPAEPPGFPEFLIETLLPAKRAEHVIGDLNERFIQHCAQFGLARAKRLYWAEALRSLGPVAWRWAKRVLKLGAIAEVVRHFFV
jgi:hypothetical protein